MLPYGNPLVGGDGPVGASYIGRVLPVGTTTPAPNTVGARAGDLAVLTSRSGGPSGGGWTQMGSSPLWWRVLPVGGEAAPITAGGTNFAVHFYRDARSISLRRTQSHDAGYPPPGFAKSAGYAGLIYVQPSTYGTAGSLGAFSKRSGLSHPGSGDLSFGDQLPPPPYVDGTDFSWGQGGGDSYSATMFIGELLR